MSHHLQKKRRLVIKGLVLRVSNVSSMVVAEEEAVMSMMRSSYLTRLLKNLS
jgi:hypothetical protein